MTTAAPPAAAGTLDSRSRQRGALATLLHGLRLTPELRAGLGVTLALALLATAGRVVVPVAVQQTIDNGLSGPSPTCRSSASPAASRCSRSP
jgi:putative ABC transport system ATP-binding protein